MRLLYTSVMCVSAMFMSLSAQDLSKEITIEKEIIPEHRSAIKLDVEPKSVSRAMTKKTPVFKEQYTVSEVPANIATLEPASCGDTLKNLKYRGYVDVGYFPIYNSVVSAGYRFLNTETTRLNAWLQYDGKVYDAEMLPDEELTLRSHMIELGASVSHKVNRFSWVTAGVDYSYNHYNIPTEISSYNESVNDLGLNIGWNSQVGVLKYNVGIDFGHFAYGQKGYHLGKKAKPVRENLIAFAGSAVMPYAENLNIGLDAKIHIVNYNRNNILLVDTLGHLKLGEADAPSYSIVSLIPRIGYKVANLNISAGVKIDLAINEGKALNIAPDVNLGWTPVTYVSVYGTLGGGKHINTLAPLFDYMRYAAPMFAYGSSTIPFSLDVGVVVGPWRGAYIELFGGYAKADDWLMPNNVNMTNIYLPTDIKGWHGGAKVGFNYHDIVDFSIRYEAASQDLNKGYYLWRDRAKNVLSLSLQVTPIKPLDIVVGYELRKDRYCNISTNELCEMGDAENVSIGANYQLKERLGLFGQIENLFNNEYLMPGNIPVQGINALVGVNYKF